MKRFFTYLLLLAFATGGRTLTGEVDLVCVKQAVMPAYSTWPRYLKNGSAFFFNERVLPSHQEFTDGYALRLDSGEWEFAAIEAKHESIPWAWYPTSWEVLIFRTAAAPVSGQDCALTDAQWSFEYGGYRQSTMIYGVFHVVAMSGGMIRGTIETLIEYPNDMEELRRDRCRITGWVEIPIVQKKPAFR